MLEFGEVSLQSQARRTGSGWSLLPSTKAVHSAAQKIQGGGL